MSLKLKIAGNTIAQLVSKGIASATTFFITLVIARQYGAAGYGDFTKIFSYIVLFYLMCDFGMNAVFLRENTHKKLHIASIVGIRLVIGILLTFVALAIISFLPFYPETNDGFSPLVKLGIVVLSPTIITMGLTTSFNALFQKHLRYDKATIASALGSITILSLIVLLSRAQASIVLLVSSYVAGGIVTVFAAYFLSQTLTSWKQVNWLEQIHFGRSLLLLSLPLGLTLVFSVIHFRADVFILTLYRTTEEVGIYGLASKFFEFALTVPTFFMNAVYPILLGVTADPVKSKRLVTKSLYILGTLSLVILTGGIIGAPLLVLVKDEFVDSIVPFRILMASLPLFFLSSVFMWYLIAQNKQWQLVWIYAVGMICNIVLNVIFIPQFGVPAAAVTTAISEGILIALLLYTALPLLRGKTIE
ncbi:MAG: polysaccharide biosynthesis C-terminal domain-containing protein [Candidatus Roizmanbacteria bacterium]|nr:polysaccharide biosynthesis C-terminal domain-containing protein [Candidatus Roizmanbacteria bacterium]